MPDLENQVELQSKRERSPSFPYIDLNASVGYAEKLFRSAKMNEVRSSDIATTWGMASGSGSFLRYLSALTQFGLLEASGSSEQRKYRLSALARRILEDDRPGVRSKLMSEAALSPRLIKGLYYGLDGMSTWGKDHRPEDPIAESFLKFDLNFGSDAAKRFIQVYDNTVKNVISDDAPLFPSAEQDNLLQAVQEVEVQPIVTESQSKAAQEPGPPQELNKINFRSDGNGSISISATLDLEGIDLLERKLAAFRLLLT